MIDFTVAIPTYNGENRLPKLLERLRNQANTEEFKWEIIIVDNNSSDGTALAVKTYQETWEKPWSLRYSFEREPGAAFARLRAIKEAKGELIGFIDDDNMPDANWVAAAYSFAQEHPKAGAYGGQIHGEFEIEPPENFQRIQSFLALRERGENPHLYQPEYLILPPAAAVVIRKQAWCASVPERLQLKGRINGKLLGGEDYEPLIYMYKAGWEIWYSPTLHTYHQIPASRLKKEYLMSLIWGSCLCICHLRTIQTKTWQKPIILAKIFLGSLNRSIRHFIQYHRRLKDDLVLACEMQFYLSSLASPLYFIKTSLNVNFYKYFGKQKIKNC